MLKATFLEGTLRLTIQPAGPLLIKAGETGGADPTRPSMEFVRTHVNGEKQIYLPGSSLKGLVRAQCERICRTLDKPGRDPEDDNPPLADNPIGDGKKYDGLEDTSYNSGPFLDKEQDTVKVYNRSAFTAQMFGHTSLAGRIRFADAYDTEPQTQPERVEMRNGVAIDRVYGSVAVGPFDYETLVSGSFETCITFRNTTLAHLALLGLALRDIAEGRVQVGFGKSRGLGRVSLTLDSFELRYPTCQLAEEELRLLNGQKIATANELAGVGAFGKLGQLQGYRFPEMDVAPWKNTDEGTKKETGPLDGLEYKSDDLLGVKITVTGDDAVRAIWKVCMPCWTKELGLG